MNALDKIKMVQKGLKCCNDTFACDGCPYDNSSDCKRKLNDDALAVIDALKAELKKRTNKAVEARPEFITLMALVVYRSDEGVLTMIENGKVAIRVDDILSISNFMDAKGSAVRLNNAQQTTFYVCETIEEILGKITKGEYE